MNMVWGQTFQLPTAMETLARLNISVAPSFASQTVCGLIVLATVTVLYLQRSSKENALFWTSIPTAGVPQSSIFPWIRAGFRSLSHTEVDTTWGYHRYCKALDMPFAVPNAGAGAVVVLPPSKIRSVLKRPTTEVEAWRAQLEILQPRYTIPNSGKGVFDEDDPHPIPFAVIRRQMTRPEDIRSFAPIVAEELRAAIAECWDLEGLCDQARCVPLWDSCSRVVSRVINRIFIGSPLCRDEKLVEQSRQYADAMFGGAAAITALPKFMRPLLGPLAALPSRKYLAGCNRILAPLVKQRLKAIEGNKDGSTPNDALQWIITESSRTGSLDVVNITQRLLILNLVSIFSTTYHLANCLLDIASSPSRDEIVAGLREECATVSDAHNLEQCFDTKEAIDQLFRMDSAVRESLRMSASAILSNTRTVAHGSGGLRLGNMVVPEGVRLAAPLHAIHHDPALYGEPNKFDAFRFSRPFEDPARRSQQASKQKMSVLMEETFLSYGFGNHGCPGRWFATQTIKQALAYILQTYDIECVGPPPTKDVLLSIVMPPKKAQLRIRRRGS